MGLIFLLHSTTTVAYTQSNVPKKMICAVGIVVDDLRNSIINEWINKVALLGHRQ